MYDYEQHYTPTGDFYALIPPQRKDALSKATRDLMALEPPPSPSKHSLNHPPPPPPKDSDLHPRPSPDSIKVDPAQSISEKGQPHPERAKAAGEHSPRIRGFVSDCPCSARGHQTGGGDNVKRIKR